MSAKPPKKKPKKPASRRHRQKNEASISIRTSAQDLAVLGPTVEVECDIPAVLKEYLKQQGDPIPPPIKGIGLIDTGASQTAVSERVCADLGLQPISSITTHGVHGAQNVDVYPIFLTVFGRQGRTFYGAFTVAAAKLDTGGLYQSKGKEMVVLLGREFLAHVKMVYNGDNGHVDLYWH